MVLSREQELWGMAAWVENHHGERGADFIQERIEKFEAEGQDEGARLWRQVQKRFAELKAAPIPIHGQPETLGN